MDSPDYTPRVAFPPEKRNSGPNYSRRIFSVLLFAALAVGSKFGHDFITSPLSLGDELPPGSWRSKCGLLSFLPSHDTLDKFSLPSHVISALSCDKAALEMSRDGVLTLYGAGAAVVWRMQGSVCDHDHPSCVEGLIIKPNGSLVIGGKQISSVTTYGDTDLSPWPFVNAPRVRVVKVKN